MNLAAYRNYKTTEAPWLGDVPSHWEVRRLRTVLRLRNEKNSPVKTEQILSLSIARGVTLYSHEGRGGNKRKGDITAYKIAHAGDIVLNSMNVIVGAVGLSRYTGAISPVYYALFPATDEVDIKYYDKVFGNTAFQRYLLIYGKGILIKKSDTGKLNTIRMKISPDDLKGTLLPIPPKEEQQQIARFLDWKTAQINKFIRNKRRFIELLKEQKQNVINQAVTRGLDPKVKLKPSGVEWIGDIPEHWEARKLKFASKMIVGGATPASGQSELWDGDVVWVTPQDVSKNERLSSSARKLTSAGFASCSTVMVPPGSVVVTSRAPVGNVSFAEVELCTNQGCKAVVPDQRYLLNEYCFVLLKVMQPVFQRAANGTTFFEISTWAFENIKAPLPPTSEQEAILAQIKEATSKIDQAITRAEREIELMREYRTRLISDVVTGQVDVRGIEVPEVAENELLALDEDIDEADDVTDEELETETEE